MVMLVIVVLGIIATLASSLSASAIKSARQATTAAALAQAKDALIGYAITYGDAHSAVHGYLPCPDTNGSTEGVADPPCGNKNVSVIGRLPWRSCSTCESSLDLPTLRDGDGECLWYAVSGTYKNNPKTDLMNWDNNGQFEILNASSAVIAQNVVAVVFAPGKSIGNQNRAPDGSAPICGGNYAAANYLDSDGVINNAAVSGVANATSQFRLASSSQINDQMIFITQQDIWNAIQKRKDFKETLDRLTQRIAECLVSYANFNNDPPNIDTNKSLPWPAPLVLTDYGSNNSYGDDRINAGRIPYRINTTNSDTRNSLSNTLLTSNGLACPGNSSNPELERLFPWWENWKDHLFYALSANFEPRDGNTNLCGSCLSINGGASKYAAVVMFAGKKFPNQTRTDKSAIANYLEGGNSTNFPTADGNENYQAPAVSSTFNDVLYCIKENLSVSTCP